MYLAKHKMYYYRTYKLDIWGFFKNNLQVLYDNTRYYIYLLNRRFRYLKRAVKRTTWEYLKHKQQIEIGTKTLKKILIDMYFDMYETLKKMYVKYIAKRKVRVIKLIAVDNLIRRFFKITISKRLSMIVFLFMLKEAEKQRIFFRMPFIYELRAPAGVQKRRRIKHQFVSFRVIKLFYWMYTYRQLKKIGKRAKKKAGVFIQNFLSVVESKLPSYLYRSSLFATVFDSLDFLKKGNVWINKYFKSLKYYKVILFDFVGFRIFYKGFIYWTYYKRMRRKAFIFMLSSSIFQSLIFLTTTLIKRFTLRALINTFSFDYLRVVNHAQ